MAVLVCYRATITEAPTFKTLRDSLVAARAELDLVIYDNSPQAQTVPAASWPGRLHYHHDASNPGVSRAYNFGAELAREQGKDWLLLLDQDTTFPVDALTAYCQTQALHPAEVMLAPILRSGPIVISPCRFVAGFGWPIRGRLPELLPLRGHSILNSGMLVRLDAFDAVGGYNELIPLDFADHDFCRRFGQRFGSVRVLDLACRHGFSDREAASLDRDLQRFTFFCRGARAAIPGRFAAAGYLLAVLLRGAVLCWRHRTTRFLPVLGQKFFLSARANS